MKTGNAKNGRTKEEITDDKRKGALCGTAKDYRVNDAKEERKKLLEAPKQDPALIKVADAKLELAVAKKEKTREGKSVGGKKTGKKNGKYIP